MTLPCRRTAVPRAQYEFPHPRGKRKIAPEARPQIPNASRKDEKKTILIVEDQYGFRQIFTDILNHGGYLVVQAEDGQKGWELVKSVKPDLVLLDLMLPNLHGFEVLANMRSEPATKDIPVIIISVLEEPAEKAKGFNLGANDYMVKSHLSHKQILYKVAALLDNPTGG